MPSDLAKFPFEPWTVVHGGQKMELAQKTSCKKGFMSNACTTILVGRASLVSEILLLSNLASFLSNHELLSMVVKKFNQLKSAQKIHASRD